MVERFDTDIDRLSAPAEDAAVLVWPEAASLEALIAHNRQLRKGYSFRLLDQPACTPPTEAPVILTGHQPDFFHPGVWIKNVAAVRLAARMGGRAICLVVNNDASDELVLRWPELDNGRWKMRRAPAPLHGRGRAFEQEGMGNVERWIEFFGQIPEAIRQTAETAFPTFSRAFLKAAATDGYVGHWIAGMQAIDAACNTASPEFQPVSSLYSSTGGSVCASTFVAHVLSHAEAFARTYNAALDDYRSRRGIHGHEHPIPDLRIDSDWIELPFWMWRSGGPRGRLCVRGAGGEIRIGHDGEAVGALTVRALRSDPGPALAAALGEWVIRPRALMLTMYARLFACDLFIHGIGGAKYDQITDALIRGFFGVEPPRYACVSATLRLPLPQVPYSDADYRNWRNRARDLKYNPQRYIREGDGKLQAAVLTRWEAIKESIQLRADRPDDRAHRREAFDRIRSANQAILAHDPRPATEARQMLDRILTGLEDNRVTMDREWFVGLHPIAALRALCDALPL